MSHGILDSASHILATTFLIYRIAGTSFEPMLTGPLTAVMAEHQLRVCGSIAAATQNLNDVWQEARGAKRRELKDAYSKFMEKWDEWRDADVLPSREFCENLIVVGPSQKSFKVEAFRLDLIDAPQRRVNWSYRIVTEEL